MKLILYQATLATAEIDFVPGPFRCQIEQQHLDFAVVCDSCLISMGLGMKARAGRTRRSMIQIAERDF